MLRHFMFRGTNSSIHRVENPETDFQPNAVDLRLEKVFKLADDGSVFVLDGDKKVHTNRIEVLPNAEGFFELPQGYYGIEYRNGISVAPNEAGWCIPRSTLIRNGVVIYSSLYDSGYGFGVEGGNKMIGSMQVCNPNGVKIRYGERVAQYLCVGAQTAHLYNGSYAKDHAKGEVKEAKVEAEQPQPQAKKATRPQRVSKKVAQPVLNQEQPQA